jgi:photosystem II stability/assembly factor-like uncharacterized protein
METPIPRSRIGSLTLGLILLSLALVALPASAARWQTLGPDDDGTVLSLAFAPSNPTFVYAGTLGGGVSRSVDSGRTWIAANAGLTDPVVNALAVFPGDHRVVWAATESGLYRSLDAGHTWTRVYLEQVDAVAVDPDNASIVYIGTRDRMFRSGNGGATWLPMGETLVPFETRFWVPALVVAPSRPQTLYAAYQGARSGIFLSENGGGAWDRIYTGAISRLAVDPRTPEALWAADRRGVLLTTDAGTTWTRVLNRTGVSALAFSRDGQRMYVAAPGQVLMSRDNGAHWRRVGTGLPRQPVYGLAVDLADPTRVLAGPEGRGAFGVISVSSAWKRTSKGLVGFAAEAIGPSPDGSGLWLASRLGLYQTTDNGASWKRMLPGTALRTVTAAPTDAMTVYAAGEVRGGNDQPAFYCSHDGGASWIAMQGGIDRGPILSLVVHPEESNIAYAGTKNGVFKTTDFGHHWTALPLTEGAAGLAIDPVDPERLYATQGRSLLHSHDGGATWHVLMDGAVPTLGARSLHGVAVAPTDPKSLAVIDGERVFVSRDSGATWQTLAGPFNLTEHRTVAFAPGNEQIILVGGHGGAAMSTDGGATWQKLGAGIAGLNVNQLRYDPTNPGKLYAATWAAGVMVLDPAP